LRCSPRLRAIRQRVVSERVPYFAIGLASALADFFERLVFLAIVFDSLSSFALAGHWFTLYVSER
jgi:hypothetical protein